MHFIIMYNLGWLSQRKQLQWQNNDFDSQKKLKNDKIKYHLFLLNFSFVGKHVNTNFQKWHQMIWIVTIFFLSGQFTCFLVKKGPKRAQKRKSIFLSFCSKIFKRFGFWPFSLFLATTKKDRKAKKKAIKAPNLKSGF